MTVDAVVGAKYTGFKNLWNVLKFLIMKGENNVHWYIETIVINVIVTVLLLSH